MKCAICGWENQEQSRVCAQCGSHLPIRAPGSLERSAPPEPAVPTVHGPIEEGKRERSALWKILWLGLVYTLATFAAFYLAGTVWPRASELVFERGWVQFAIVILFGWSIGILWNKRGALGRQRKLSVRKLLAGHPTLTADSVAAALSEIQQSCQKEKINLQNHYLARRIWRALEAFRAQGRVDAAGDVLRHASEVDASTIDAGYTLVRVFIWAIPILGFIGTVIGIGDAVQGFSSFIQKVEDVSRLQKEITPALSGVTSGLSIAFDTTLLALLLSIPTMVFASSSQKREEELLNEVDTEAFTLLDRLKEAGTEQGVPTDLDALRSVFTELGAEMVKLVTTSVEQHSHGINRVVEASLDRYENILTQLLKSPVQALEVRLQETQQVAEQVGGRLDAALTRSEKAAERLSESETRMDGQLAQLGTLNGHLQVTTGELNAAAEQLVRQRGGFTIEGDRWLSAFNGSKSELLGALRHNQTGLEEARRWFERPRPIRLKAIELVEEIDLGEE
jgi:biopolymer transport protein ExbB/TolQ